jgi:hypothetical protein
MMRVSPRSVIPRKRETAEMAEVIVLARALRWRRIYHTHDSRRSNPGFPDLVLCKPPRLLFLEIKVLPGGRESDPQIEWMRALRECGAEAYTVWLPDEWNALRDLLSSAERIR